MEVEPRLKKSTRNKLQQTELANDALIKENIFLESKIEIMAKQLNDQMQRRRTMSADETPSNGDRLQRRPALISQSGDMEIKVVNTGNSE